MILHFGKYKGKNIEDIPSDYLKWIMEKFNGDEEIIIAAEKEYEYRSNWKKHFWSEN
jgi:hypothetical protein